MCDVIITKQISVWNIRFDGRGVAMAIFAFASIPGGWNEIVTLHYKNVMSNLVSFRLKAGRGWKHAESCERFICNIVESVASISNPNTFESSSSALSLLWLYDMTTAKYIVDKQYFAICEFTRWVWERCPALQQPTVCSRTIYVIIVCDTCGWVHYITPIILNL